MTEETPDESFVEEEEDAAGAEAAGIGGRRPDYDVDDDRRGEEWRAVEEAGEGDEEGFELAEHDLIEEASHGDEGRDPEVDAFTPERESDEATAEYGEADEVEPEDL
jgi:hypothetical protein